jgi:hypothetical protein
MRETRNLGLPKLYLCTDLEGYYEKYEWTFLAIGYMFNGDATKIFEVIIRSTENDRGGACLLRHLLKYQP